MSATRWNVFRWKASGARELLSVHRSLEAAQRAREVADARFPGEVYVEGWKGRGASWDVRAKPRRAGGVGCGCGRAKAGSAMAKLTGEAKRKFLAKMAAGRRKAAAGGAKPRKKKRAAGITGATVKRGKKRGNRAGSAMVKASGGAIGRGTPAVRLARVERAVVDLAKVNKVIVDKVVDHEKRLGKVESIAAQWARGRSR